MNPCIDCLTYMMCKQRLINIHSLRREFFKLYGEFFENEDENPINYNEIRLFKAARVALVYNCPLLNTYIRESLFKADEAVGGSQYTKRMIKIVVKIMGETFNVYPHKITYHNIL
jgi:hypothetical protein